MVEKINALFKSRRFWKTVGSVVSVVLMDVLGLSIEQSALVVTALSVWVLGDSWRETK